MRVDATEFERPFRPVGKSAKDRQPIRNYHFVALAHRLQNLAAGKDAGDVTEPMLQDLRRKSPASRAFSPLISIRCRQCAGASGSNKRTVKLCSRDMMRTAE